jgi:hypothetical protein
LNTVIDNGHVLACGLEQAGYTMRDGLIYRGVQRVPIHEEVDLFTLLSMPWVAPESREV